MSTPMTVESLRIRPEDQESTASDMKIVARNAALGGHYSVMQGAVRPKEILAFHTHHNEDQHMYIISGELHFEVGGADRGRVRRDVDARGLRALRRASSPTPSRRGS
ncbi:MAG: hypothetical protein RKU31_07740 [Deltaproteobacteria bacterium]